MKAAIFGGLALAGIVSAPAAAQSDMPAWMSGCWEMRDGERWAEECWTSPREGQMLADVSPRRYFCTACHVPQADTAPLVGNTFTDMSELGVGHAGDQ